MASKDRLREEVARIVIEAALPHLRGWIDTLGEMGAPRKDKEKNIIDARSRVSAAKTGVDFVTKFIGDAGASAVGSDLLKDLERLGNTAESYGTAGRHRTEDPDAAVPEEELHS